MDNCILHSKLMFFLFVRDGVSDGQFEMVLNNELGALKKVCFLKRNILVLI
jgi:hypothetical protein